MRNDGEKTAVRRRRQVGDGLAAELAVVAALTLLAAAFRLYRLDVIPPGLHFDEAHNGLDARRIIDGARPIFLATNDGREVLYSYLQAVVVASLGPTVLALRLTSALLGVATVPLTYAFVRQYCGRRAVAVVTSVLLATSLWHVALSRIGVRSVAIPLLIIPALWLFWEATRQPQRRWRFALSGVFIGLGAYIHPANLFLPLAVTAFAAYLAATDRARASQHLAGLAVAGGVALLVFLPFGRYVVQHADAVLEHPSRVSVMQLERPGDGPVDALARNAWNVALAFTVRGDTSAAVNLPERPIFDPVVALFFLAGVLWLCWQIIHPADHGVSRDRSVLLVLWLGVMVVPSVVSNDAPHFKRMPGIIPVVFILPAQALVVAGSWLAGRSRPALGVALTAALLLASGIWTFRDYFLAYPIHREVPATFMVATSQKGIELRRIAQTGDTYVAPVLMSQSVVAFRCLDSPLTTLELRDGLVRRDGASATYVLDPVEADVIDAFQLRWGAWMTREDLLFTDGGSLLAVFQLPATTGIAPQRPQTARFGELIDFLGYSLDESAATGDSPTVTLFWRALGPLPADYTTFVHLLDAAGNSVGQQDKPPLGGTYPTSRWRPGDMIIDRFEPVIEAGTIPGSFSIWIGWYDLESGERLPGVDARSVPLPGSALRLE